MGFNKRRLTEGLVKTVYETHGLKGLTDFITKPDALFTNSEKTSNIVGVVMSNTCDTNKEIEINKILYGKNGGTNE